MSDGRPPRRCHSDRGILEQYDGKFIKKVPQTSVAPTYKLTLPSEFVVANLSHLIDQTFDLTDREGSDSWKVALLPRRNKSKFEYTLQGWKAFALSHSVRSGDRLQIELLPDGRRMRADIVKRASPKDRAMAMADSGPASPAVIDVASVAKPCSDDHSVGTSGDDERAAVITIRGRRTSLASDPSSSHSRQHGSAATLSAGPTKSSGIAENAHISSALLQHASEQLHRHMDRGTSGHFSRVEIAGDSSNRLHERVSSGAAPARGFGRWQPPGRAAARQLDEAHAAELEQTDKTHAARDAPYTPSQSQARGPHHPKRPRSVFQQAAYMEPPARESKKHAGLTDYEIALTRGMQLLTSAAGLDAEPEDVKEHHNPLHQAMQTMLSSNGAPTASAKSEPPALSTVLDASGRVIESETSRGLMVVSALLKIAERLGSPGLLRRVEGSAAEELRAMQAELKEHTNTVLDGMCHMRGLPKTWKQA